MKWTDMDPCLFPALSWRPTVNPQSVKCKDLKPLYESCLFLQMKNSGPDFIFVGDSLRPHMDPPGPHYAYFPAVLLTWAVFSLQSLQKSHFTWLALIGWWESFYSSPCLSDGTEWKRWIGLGGIDKKNKNKNKNYCSVDRKTNHCSVTRTDVN